MKQRPFIAILLFLNISSLAAGRFDFFPVRRPFFSPSTAEFRHYLYTGSENGTLVNHGNLGAAFPIAGFSFNKDHYSLFGVAASAHLVMFPEGMKFLVDNFYATLAVYADCLKSQKTSFRWYPVYHVSGHLGDGTKTDTLFTNPRAVSGEMAAFEMSFSPRSGITVSALYGFYYHVCAQQGLTDRFDLAFQWQPAEGKNVVPFFTVSGQFIHLVDWRPGIDMEAGIKFVNAASRGIGIGIRYFNRMHPGYYFDQREESAGGAVVFLL